MSFRTQTGSFSLAANYDSAPFEILLPTTCQVQLKWSGVSVFDALAKIQTCIDPALGWNDIFPLEQNRTIIDSASDTQIWELLELTGRYIRLHYEKNSNTTGFADFKIIAFA